MKSRSKKAKRSPVQHPGIVAHARALNVSRIHLWFVLTGVRESKILNRRYRELMRKLKSEKEVKAINSV